MTNAKAVAALAALAQETRLEIFRRLVEQGPEGLPAGVIAAAVKMVPSSLSFHLTLLTKAGLIVQRRQGRSLIYAVNIEAMNGLVSFLTENCCGNGAAFLPVCPPQAACCPANEVPAPPRRRQRAR
jgi:ArsR family transcriptional regulator